jgi:hypothetical protein
MTMSILDLLQHIVNEPAPKLGEPFDGPDSEEGGFVDACLLKDPTTRPSPAELLVSRSSLLTCFIWKDTLTLILVDMRCFTLDRKRPG